MLSRQRLWLAGILPYSVSRAGAKRVSAAQTKPSEHQNLS
jgi:hypothetical protein